MEFVIFVDIERKQQNLVVAFSAFTPPPRHLILYVQAFVKLVLVQYPASVGGGVVVRLKAPLMFAMSSTVV